MEGDITEIYHISQGNELAFDSFMDRYSARIFYHVYGIVGNKEIAEEVVSDVFFEVWQHRKNLMKITNMVSWLNTIAFHKALNAVRSEVHNSSLSIDDLPDFFFPKNQSPLESIITKEERQELNKAIKYLLPRCKHVFFLAKIEQMPYADIAQLLDISIATVNYHVAYALATLKKRFKTRNYEQNN